MSSEMVIFTRTFDLLQWLIPRTEKFPKSQRFIITQRLLNAALDFQEKLFEANVFKGQKRLENLQAADASLMKLRLYLRLTVQFQWLTQGQYEHISRMVEELGKLLGGWIKQTGK